MLMDIKCSAISSILIQLSFDDGSIKKELIAVDDLIDVEYNKNGRRVHFHGIVIKIDTTGPDPKGWYIILDGSDDYDAQQARFSPKSILDIAVIRKANTARNIKTPLGCGSIDSLRIVKGRLQYSTDGLNWQPILVDGRDVQIKDEEGTVPNRPSHCDKHHHHIENDEDIIKDES